MGKIAIQSYSEKNTKLIPAAPSSSSSSSNNGAGSSGGTGGGHAGGESAEGGSGGKLVVNKVTNYMSSIAGASSSEFDTYVALRRRERERMEQIEKQAVKLEQEQDFAGRVASNRKEAEERTKKNAMKRKRKKENQKKNKAAKLKACDDSGEESDDEEEEGKNEEKRWPGEETCKNGDEDTVCSSLKANVNGQGNGIKANLEQSEKISTSDADDGKQGTKSS